MNLRMVSMPVQKTAACSTHSSAKVKYPSVDNPRNPCWVTSPYGSSAGQTRTSRMSSAAEAR